MSTGAGSSPPRGSSPNALSDLSGDVSSDPANDVSAPQVRRASRRASTFDGSLAPGEQDLESKMIPTLERVRCVEDALLVSNARISTDSSTR